MYPLQQSNELENQIPCVPCQADQILNDLVTLESTTNQPSFNSNTGKKPQHRRSFTEIQENKNVHGNTATTSANEHKIKKILHRDIERQRRQEMANLYGSLRSLLPLEYIKGKRAISDHMQEAVNYIKFLQKNISELQARRDRLVIKTCNLIPTVNSGNGNGSADSCYLRDCGASVMVSQVRDGVEVLISTSPKEETFPVSKVLKKLIREGLNVVSCVSTTINEIKVHKILAEGTDVWRSIDTVALQQQLMNVISLVESYSE